MKRRYEVVGTTVGQSKIQPLGKFKSYTAAIKRTEDDGLKFAEIISPESKRSGYRHIMVRSKSSFPSAS